MITPAELKSDFLFGIPLIDGGVNTMPDSALERHIKSAISRLEHKFNVTITPTQYVEYRDYRAEDYDHWFFINVQHKPISPSADDLKIEIQYIKDATLVEMPKAWYRIYPEAGQIQMTPTSGSMGQFIISQAGMIPPGLWGIKKDYPQLIKVTYVAGWEEDKIPYVIVQLIGYMASVDILMMLSDLTLGVPGLNSYGIGLDGLSQSVTKEGFQRRIDNYNAKIQELMHELMSYYQSFTFTTL